MPYGHLCSWSTPREKTAVVGKTWPNKTSLKMTIVYLLVYSKGKEPKAIAVERRLDF